MDVLQEPLVYRMAQVDDKGRKVGEVKAKLPVEPVPSDQKLTAAQIKFLKSFTGTLKGDEVRIGRDSLRKSGI